MDARHREGLVHAAEGGNATAAYVLACNLNRGEAGFARSRGRAERWLRISAERGYSGALLVLFERCLVRDLPRALRYGARCIAAGPSNPARDVALQLVYGPKHEFDPVKARMLRGPDPRRGVAWLRNLAELGDVRAMEYLVQVGSGYGPLPRDLRQAEFWAKRALAGGKAEVLGSLAVDLFNGRFGRRDRSRAARLYRLAAAAGDEHAWHNLGLCYKLGDGVRKDERRYVECMREAARLGHPDAGRQLAMAYWDGLGVPRDRKRAAALARKRMRAGDLDTGAWYGCVLTEVESDPRAQRRGVEILKEFARRGSDAAANDLAVYYHDLKPRSRYLPQALGYYRRAIELGSATAMENYARCILDGHEGLLPRNRRAAISLLRRASRLGNEDAQKLLPRVQPHYSRGGKRESRPAVRRA
jgi:TPR repeat protein